MRLAAIPPITRKIHGGELTVHAASVFRNDWAIATPVIEKHDNRQIWIIRQNITV
jgi:hypothetical protein